MLTFKPFDYCVIVLGAIGTFNVLGGLGNTPNFITLTSGIFSSLIFVMSFAHLTINIFAHHLTRRHKQVHAFFVMANILPALYLLAHLKETPWFWI